MSKDTAAPGPTVVCRLPRSIAALPVVFAVSGLLMLIVAGILRATSKEPVVGFVGISLALWAVAALVQFIFQRVQVIADAEGIRWRGTLRSWRRMRWDEITDYYQESRDNIDGTRTEALRVCTATTSLYLPKINREPWQNMKEFGEAVRARATQARVGDWEILGTRPVDAWPRTFAYAGPRTWTELALFSVATLVYIAFAAVKLTAHILFLRQWIGWGETWPIALGLTLLFSSFLLLFAMRLVPLIQAMRRHGESITVTPTSLTYRAAHGETITVPWSEITDYFYAGAGRFTVVLAGAGERQVSWLGTLENSALLNTIIQRYAPKPRTVGEQAAGWRVRAKHERTHESDPRTWQSGAVGIGGRVFRARDHRETRTLCVLPVVMVAALVYAGAVPRPGRPPESGLISLIVSAVLALVAAGVIAWLCTYRVETDENGLTLYSLRGKWHRYWYTIADYTGTGDITITGRDGGKMTIPSLINGLPELKAEIARYAPPPQTGFTPMAAENVDKKPVTDSPAAAGVQSEAVPNVDVQQCIARHSDR